MRKLAFATFIALALAIASVAPTFAESIKNGDSDARINVWCSVDKGTQVDVQGDLLVSDGNHGVTTLWLFGSNDGKSWVNTNQSKVVHIVKGQTSYSFSFNAILDSSHFTDYRVVGDGATSRVINGDECGFRVPEAPATPLLLLGAFPAGALIAVKATVAIPIAVKLSPF